jgi:hypothetical protein
VIDMRLTWKDGVATMLVGLAVAAALAAVGDWGWPLLGSNRPAVIVLGLIGLAACAVAGGGQGAEAKEPPRFIGVLGGVSLVGHVAVLGLIIAGLVVPSDAVVVVLASLIVGLWLVGSVHHARLPAAPASTSRHVLHAH